MTPAELLNETIEAHGGRARWRRVEAITATLSSGGLAFQSRCQPNALKNLTIEVRPHDVAVTLADFVRPGWKGIWTPARAAIHDADGRLVEERSDPRSHFRGLVNQVYWDKLDILTFAGYALWNYLSFPFLLDGPDVALIGADGPSQAGILRLDVRFAAGAPTHSAIQSFHIDPQRRLVQHDYVAEPIGDGRPARTSASTAKSSTACCSIRGERCFRASVRGGGSSRFPRSSGSKSTTFESCSTRDPERCRTAADVRLRAAARRLSGALGERPPLFVGSRDRRCPWRTNPCSSSSPRPDSAR